MTNTIDTTLDWLWQTTWQAALLATVIAIIVRVFRNKLSPGAVSLLWMLVFVRLAMPVLPGSPVSIFALLGAKPAPAQVIGWASPVFVEAPVVIPTLAVPIAASADPLRWLEYGLVAIWIIGAGALIGHVIVSTIRFGRRVRRWARPADPDTIALVEECCHQQKRPVPGIVITEIVSTPALFGVLSPRLLIPPAVLARISREELRSVVLHELEHLRRRHLLSDWVFMLIKAVHWFNPAAWWAHRQIRAARELICDQSVLAKLDESDSRRYGLTMLALAGGLRPTPAGVPVAAFARDYRLLKQRIEAIASRRRYLAGLGVLLAGLLAMSFLTSPASTAQDPPAAEAQKPPTTGESEFASQLRFAETDLAYKAKVLERTSAAGAAFSAMEIEQAKLDVERARANLEVVRAEASPARIEAASTARLRFAEADLEYKSKVYQRMSTAPGAFSAAEIEEARLDVERAKAAVEMVKSGMRAPATQPMPAPAAALNPPRRATTQEVVSAFVERAQQLIRESDFEQAVLVLKQVLEQDPANEFAKNALPLVEDRAVIERQRDARRRFDNVVLRNAPPDPATAQLERVLPEVRFENVGFESVIDFLRDVSGANIAVNWRALEAAKIDKAAPVSARLRDVKFAKALEVILDDVAGGAGKIGYVVDRGVITISTVDDLKKAAAQPAAQGALKFPDNWPAQDIPPNRADAAEKAKRAEDLAVIGQLDRNLPEIRFDNTPFTDVLDFFRDLSGANIFVNWRALEAAGVPRNKPVTARLRDVKFSKALETVLRDVGGEKVRLGYSIDEGVITISTTDDLQANTVTTVYDIIDLQLPVDPKTPEKKKELTDALILLITDTVARESWRVNNGKVGAIQELQGQLIVTQTPDNQRDVLRLLTQLRETRAVQVVTQATLMDVYKAHAARLWTVQPSSGIAVIENFEVPGFAQADVRPLLVPQITSINGQKALLRGVGDNAALALEVTATISANGQFVTLSIAKIPAVPNNAVERMQPMTISVPDGAAALWKLGEAGPDREYWVAIKPTITLQRDLPP